MRKLFLIMMTLLACTWSVQAQTRTYHGTVLDASDNEPLVGATIMPIGGGQGVAADVEGKFTLVVPSNVDKAKVSYVGFATQVVQLHEGMTIYLQNATTALDNVVVVAYGTASRESLTGSVAVVGAQEIEDRPVTSVTAALEGNAPGVQVNNSTGTPGSQPTIRIRGFNSINGNNNPLYVVDGVPFEGDINDLNPSDIESMSVLKDAASCALYGNRGANGVILITTKKAKTAGTIDVTLTMRQGMYNRGLPFYDRLGPNEWMQQYYDAAVMGDARYNDVWAPTTGEDVQLYRAFYAGQLPGYEADNIISDWIQNNIYGVADNQLFDPTTGKFIGGNPLPGYTDLDWWKAVARNGYRQEYTVNAAGATDKFNAFASLGYLDEKGYTLGTDFRRFTARLNANYQPTNYLRLGLNFAGTQQNSETGDADSSNLNAVNNPFNTQFKAPVYPYYMHDANGNIIYEDGSPVWNTAGYNEGTNVAWEMRKNINDYNKTAIDGNAYMTAIIPYGFELTVRGQMFRNKTNYTNYSNNIVGSQAGSGMLQKEFDEYRSYTFMQMLSWEHEYGLNHIDVLLDHENFNSQSYYDYVAKSGQLLDIYPNLNIFEDVDLTQSGSWKIRTESYLGRLRYNYDQKYFGEFSLRRDGSSRFSKEHRWGTFWSLGASWVISKEKFMQDVDWVNFLKLRAAYGTVGNDASAPRYAASTYYGVGVVTGGSPMSLIPAYIGNTNLKWETTRTFDVALEGSLFNDRFNFSVGYFNKYNSDLLFQEVLPSSMGTLDGSGYNPSIWRNIGDMLNYGWELQFGVDIIRNRNLKWDFNVDVTFLKNKVKKLPGGHDLPAQGLFYNKSLYQLITYTWAGVDQMTGQSVYEIDPYSTDFMGFDADGNVVYDEASFQSYVAAAEASAATGNHVFIEKDGKYYTSNTAYATRQIQADALPTAYGSFSTNLAWKGISLGLLFTYQIGGHTIDYNYASLMGGASQYINAMHKDVLNAWTGVPEGMTIDSPDRIDPNGVPIQDIYRSGFNNATSSRFITNSSYLALKNLSISYSLPKSWVSAMKMKDLNIGAYIDNVFIATKRKGMNPTYGFAGDQGAYYVPARVFAFQLQAKF